MSVGGGGGGYSGGGGGFSGGFAPPPMFGGGFGQQFPSYGGGFGAFGPQPYSGFGGGFGGGFGMPQQPQYGGGFGGGFGGSFGQPQPPQFGGGFGQFQPPQFGGGFGQSGPGNAYARPFPGLQPQPAPPPQQLTPPPGMELNPDYRPRDVAPGMFTTMEIRPNENRFRPIQAERAVMPEVPTGGGYPSRDQFNQTFQVMPAVMPEVPTGGGYPSRDQFVGQPMPPTMIEPAPQTGTVRPAVMPSYENLGLSGLLGRGLGGLFGGYQAMPFGGYQQFDQQYPSNYQAAQQQMALDRQRMQQGNFNQPPPGMKLNPTYDAGYAMAQDMPPPGSPQALRKQQFIPI